METKTATSEIPLRTHREFIDWVASHVNGKSNHYKTHPIRFGNIVPDVCVMAEDRLMEMHEIEVTRVGQKRVTKYNKFPRPKSVLWLCIPPLEKAFDEVRVIAYYKRSNGKVNSVAIRPRRETKGTLVWIRCPDCDQTFDDLKTWNVHLISCKERQKRQAQEEWAGRRL